MTYSTISPAAGETVRTFEDISDADLDDGHLDACLRMRDAGHITGRPLQFSIVLGVKAGWRRPRTT